MTLFWVCMMMSLGAGKVFSAPEVRTKHGKIRGSNLHAQDTKKLYYAYYGIPFAKPPVGALRFMPPVSFKSWRSRRRINSDTYKPRCMQTSGYVSHEMSEDCLYLNVFTPAIQGRRFNVNAGKKVIVYIHGGAFATGDTFSYPPSNLVTDFDVIIVTIAFRVGPFGFLSSGDEALPGNLGLLDQIMALYWIKDNIKLFGGDQNDITIYGTSAGAACASLLAISPLAKGLFTKVGMDGGSALAPWAIDVTSQNTFYLLAEKANCLPVNFVYRCRRRKRVMCPKPSDYHRQIVKCLRKVDASKVVQFLAEETRTSEEDVLSMEGYTSFGPVVDGFVIPRDPFQLMEDAGYLKDIGTLDRKYMMGFSNNEAMLFVYGSLAGEIIPMDSLRNPDNEVAQKIIQNNLRSVLPCPASQEVLDIASFLYYYPRDAKGNSDVQGTLDFMSDVDFIIPAVQYVRALVKASSDVDVFMSLLDYYPKIIVPSFPFTGATHGMSLAYIFDTSGPMIPLLFYANVSSTSEDNFPLFNIIRGTVANLAKHGDPSLPGVVQWPKYDRVNETYLAISSKPEVRQHVYSQRVSMWTDFLPRVLNTVFTRGRGRAPYPE